jgi:hypothetical protein
MYETYESPLSKPRKVAATVNDAVVITVTIISVYSLCKLGKDLVEAGIERHQEKKAKKNQKR